MITSAIIGVVYLFVLLIVALISNFGDVSTTGAMTTAITSMKEYYMSLNGIMPIDTIVAIIAFDLIFELSVLSYKLLRWAYQKVPMVH